MPTSVDGCDARALTDPAVFSAMVLPLRTVMVLPVPKIPPPSNCATFSRTELADTVTLLRVKL